MVIDCGVPTVWVVESFEVIKDYKANLRPVGERFLHDQFAFERREEGFGAVYGVQLRPDRRHTRRAPVTDGRAHGLDSILDPKRINE